ncbi:hypothetical protein HDF15_004238 [Granulicella mallensis]|uniref:Uncharacterized protein n=1 Tax=Granulicella mallensis TaxID=940614 RepID=A0A7W8EAQ4_9BACT|nr:hypothetical protein [Granulicella mallensis]
MRWGDSFISSFTRAVNGRGRAAVDRSPLQGSEFYWFVTQGYALGWYGVAPLGLGAVACFEP